MGKLRDASWYNAHFKKKKLFYSKPPSASTVYPLYRDSAQWVINLNLPVTDVGCGPGILYAELRERGFGGRYKGVDFSSEALSIAESLKRSGDNKCSFVNADLESIIFSPKVRTSYVICETLEHLEHDVELIQKIPFGSPLWISVPNFDVASHVRHFKEQQSAVERYGKFFQTFSVNSIPIVFRGKEFHRYYVIAGMR